MTINSNKQIETRKKEGIDLALQNIQAKNVSTLFECVHLIHNALPELNLSDIDTSTKFLGHDFQIPILVDSMTGGTPAALKINTRLAQVAEQFNIGMGVGSQRAGLLSSRLASTFKIVRKNAPNAFIFSNIGGAQLAEGLKTSSIRALIDMIDADALAIHLNPLQELVQPEGEPNFRGILKRIHELSKDLKIPIIVKEVGSGISPQVAVKLQKNNINAINVAGVGGTSWAGIEQKRAIQANLSSKINMGLLLWDWGIPTAASLLLAKKSVKLPLVSSGGMRNGLDLAKSIILGASMGAYAQPMIKSASQSYNSLTQFVEDLHFQLKSIMFLVGAQNIKQLKSKEYVITEPLTSWIHQISGKNEKK